MSGKIKSAKLEDMAAGVTLGRVTPPAEPEPPLAELIARFQLETETALAGLRGEMVKMVTELERRVAGMIDEWTRTREEVTALGRRTDDAIHQMTQSVRECLNAQKESVGAAQRAETAVRVFDKLKEAQPDLHRMVRDQDKVVASVRDELALIREQVQGYGKRLDEFDVVAEDYQETRGDVRGLDLVVKDLRSEALQRRQVGGRS